MKKITLGITVGFLSGAISGVLTGMFMQDYALWLAVCAGAGITIGAAGGLLSEKIQKRKQK